MKNDILLTDKYINYLQSLPENGMGYQIVNLFLKNGKIIKDVIVLNASHLMIDEELNPQDIIKIELSVNKIN